jgi:hypothetical protein
MAFKRGLAGGSTHNTFNLEQPPEAVKAWQDDPLHLPLEQPPEVVKAWQEDHLHLFFWNSLQKKWRTGRRILSIFTFGTASRSSRGLAGVSSPSLTLGQHPEVVED